MKYLFLAYRDETQWAAMSPDERDAFESACLANEQELRRQGHLLAVEDLQKGNPAIVVQFMNGRVSLGDGLPTGVREQLIRLFSIEARDLNEVIRVASQMPQVRAGPIEVRPVIGFDLPAKSN